MAPPARRPLDPVLDALPCGYLAMDEEGTVLVANATLAALAGMPRDEIEGQPLDAILSAAGRIFHSTHLFPLLRLHGHADEVYLPLRGADGTEVPVLVNAASRSDDGRTEYDLVIVPMRQRNELESELLAARHLAEQGASAKDRFLSIVSHELRTPITAVRGFAELLLRERSGPLTDKQRRYATQIRDAATYQARLIEDILDFARQAGERRQLEIGPLAVREALDRVEAILRVRASEQGRTLRRAVVPSGATVRADPHAVQQILLNLGTNALKFSPDGGLVTIGVAVDGPAVRISVTDAGPGIPREDLERIFEPFVQLGTAPLAPDSRRGIGLGLAISRDLARAMEGDISVASTVGAGSTFTLELPAARD